MKVAHSTENNAHQFQGQMVKVTMQINARVAGAMWLKHVTEVGV